MRPTLTAVIVALVLMSAAFLFVVQAQDRDISNPVLATTGARTDLVTPTYGVSLALSSVRTLPGYHDTLSYEVLNDTSGAPITTLSSITIRGTYYNTADVLLSLPGTPINLTPSVPIGSWSFVVPANSSSTTFDWPLLTVWANSTSMNMSAESEAEVDVGTLEFSEFTVCNVVGSCGNPGDLTTGNPATVEITTEIATVFGDSPAVNETAKFLFYSTGSSPVTVAGVPASVKTNPDGYAAVTFTPLSTVFNVPGPDHVEIEVTDAVNASLVVDENVTFNLYNPMGAANFAFWLNTDLYYSGESGTGYWQWAGTNSTVGAINVTNYYVEDDATGDIVTSGLIYSTSASGSFPFTIPSSYAGDFEVRVFVHNGTEEWELEAGATADLSIFTAIPNEIYFDPGDTITVAVTAEGPALTGTTVSAFVQAENSGQTLYNSTVSGGSFQFTIPKIAPAEYYRIAVWASSPTAGTVASVEEEIDEASGYNFWAGVSTVSSYSDGSFAPGQTVSLSYSVTPYGTSQPPKVVELELLPGPCSIFCGSDTPAIKIWFTTSPSGSVPFTIPSSTPNGLQTFTVLALWDGGDGGNQITVNVNSSPSALNYELGAGSGLTVGWLILLILLIVVVIVLVAMGRRRGPSRMVMTPTTATTAPPEWKEQSQSGGGGASGGGTTGGGSAGSSTPPPGTQ